jgi:benzoyl-CoA reductase/2-hydroxyglutaryl-CoA dehydratase subunit BcrC/BadD/HgdB
MMQQYFSDLVAGIEAGLRDNPRNKSPRKMYALEVARLGVRLYSKEERIAWCGIVAPFDLLSAMGVTSCFVEFIGAMLASTGMVEEFLETAEHAGFGGDTCGYHRAVIGANINRVMPEPDFLVGTSCPCTGGLAVMENLAREFEKDLFVLNVPQEPSGENIRYLADRMKALTRFVSDHTGKALDDDRLQEAVAYTNQARDLMQDAYRYARRVPSPVNGKLLNNFGIVMALLLGTPAAVTVCRAYRDEFKTRVEKETMGVTGERFRLLWIQNRIQFKNPLVEFLEKEYRAAIVIDELNDITWDPIDPRDPYTGFAQRAISIPFNGRINRRIRHLQKLAKDYRVHGAINPCHWGCRQGTGARGLISEGLNSVGVPVLNLEVDCVDPRNFSEGQLRTRLEAFMEMLESRLQS